MTIFVCDFDAMPSIQQDTRVSNMEFPISGSQAAKLLREHQWESAVEGEFSEFSSDWLGTALGVKLAVRENSEPITPDWEHDFLLVGAIPNDVRDPVRWVTIRGGRAL